ncbi:diamine N-acetyltransferase [Enterococcus sp. AZ194]|uniref:GNAT family N-acetyltransferase n=1 Tax=Enterococcus sp. AZ194 TaxID=2774629 RepID=UPI003F29ECDA
MMYLNEITQKNYKVCVKLSTDKEQEKFVAPNWYSLLEAKFEENRKAFGLYNEEEMVGFVMFSYSPADEDYSKDSWWIERYMIASKFQNKGFGKTGLQKSIEWFVEQYPTEELRISVVEGNEIAQNLYEKVGFVLTGERVQGEIVLLKVAK